MSLQYNLQFFAKDGPGGEKTEQPTAKKLDDARKEGQVAKSKEIANATTLLALFALMNTMVRFFGGQFLELFHSIYSQIPDYVVCYDGDVPFVAITMAIRNTMGQILLTLLPVLLIGFVIAFVSNLIQVGWKPTTKPMQPKFSKLNPINGFKRLLSKDSIVELIKAIMKVGAIGIMVFTYLRHEQDKLLIVMEMSLWDCIAYLGKMIMTLGLRIAVIYAAIAALDFLYQKWKFREDMKMTKQEVKDEYKNQEGDPQIKGKQKQRMQEASRRRMMQQLPQADVVITNPTHFAVAIKYDPDMYDAPYVVAKGADYLAARIKEIARENDIEIVENKPLARMLYANVELGQIVPPELYQAVAEVLAFVYHLKGKA